MKLSWNESDEPSGNVVLLHRPSRIELLLVELYDNNVVKPTTIRAVVDYRSRIERRSLGIHGVHTRPFLVAGTPFCRFFVRSRQR